jgi:DNA-binding PucR family transcriptional regulator
MQLTPTLHEYLAADGHHGRTCQRLYIGVTTLKYRLGRIEELLDVDLRDGTTRFELRLALQLADVLDAQRRAATAGPVG